MFRGKLLNLFFLRELTYGSRRSQMFFKIGLVKNFVMFTGKYLCWSLFLKRLFSCEYYEILKNSFFYRTPLVAASSRRTILQSNLPKSIFWEKDFIHELCMKLFVSSLLQPIFTARRVKSKFISRHFTVHLIIIESFQRLLSLIDLTLSWRRPLSYRNQSIDLLCKSMD